MENEDPLIPDSESHLLPDLILNPDAGEAWPLIQEPGGSWIKRILLPGQIGGRAIDSSLFFYHQLGEVSQVSELSFQ